MGARASRHASSSVPHPVPLALSRPRFVELLSVAFARSPDDHIRASITFRYNAVKSKLAIVSARLGEVTNVVKIKNPSLLLQLQQARAVPMVAAPGGGAAAAGGATPSVLGASGGAMRGSVAGRMA